MTQTTNVADTDVHDATGLQVSASIEDMLAFVTCVLMLGIRVKIRLTDGRMCVDRTVFSSLLRIILIRISLVAFHKC